MNFQTRSETHGICLHTSFQDAMIMANSDKSIWKISFIIPETNEPICLIRIGESDDWKYESIWTD